MDGLISHLCTECSPSSLEVDCDEQGSLGNWVVWGLVYFSLVLSFCFCFSYSISPLPSYAAKAGFELLNLLFLFPECYT